MSIALASCLVAFIAGLGIERLAAAAGSPALSARALPARFLVFAILYLFWLGVWGRPILAGVACLVTLAVMTGISIRKRQLVGEPLGFSDFGLLQLIVQHPDLYYTEFMAKPPFLAGATAFLTAVGLWLWLEPAYRVLSAPASVLLIAAVLAGLALLWRVATVSAIADPLRAIVPAPALDEHVARWGLLTTLVAYALRWRSETALPYAEPISAPPGPGAPLDPDLAVIVQFESFLDPARIGLSGMPLPGLARARALALQHGPLRVPAHGAFTMRSEHAVLTGLSPVDLGFRSFDPYLGRRGPVPSSLPRRLAERGFRTVFMHPFRANFFGRDAVIPRLGFQDIRFEDDFEGAERFGPYVSDRAMAERILAEAARTEDGPALIAAVTMENHGPWSTGRLAEEPDPTRQYLRHLANADAAISLLIDGLSARGGRTLLCIFGDHPPILPGLVPSATPETDYAVLAFGAAASAEPSQPHPISADELGRLLMGLCGVSALPRPNAL